MIKVGDVIEMTEDGGMFKKGDRYIVNGVEEKFFYYCGNLALSINDPRYIILPKGDSKDRSVS